MYIFFYHLFVTLNTDAPTLNIGSNLTSPVPLYNFVAARGEPSCTYGNLTPPVVGAAWKFFATCAFSDR